MGGEILSVPSPESKQGQAGCHHARLQQKGHIHLATLGTRCGQVLNSTGVKWGAGKLSHPTREMDDNSGSCSLWRKMVSACRCQTVKFSYFSSRWISFTVLPFSKEEAGTQVMQELHGIHPFLRNTALQKDLTQG